MVIAGKRNGFAGHVGASCIGQSGMGGWPPFGAGMWHPGHEVDHKFVLTINLIC
jgi:hypothetical protein